MVYSKIDRGVKILKLKPNSLICVDCDGTLTIQADCWSEKDMINAKPNQDVIRYINQLYLDGHHICIYTARSERFRAETEYWLKKHDVRFHVIRMDKMGSDLYIDDKSIHPKDINKPD